MIIESHLNKIGSSDSQTVIFAIPDMSIVVPTKNEHDNIWPLLESLHNALHNLHVEVIFVDDSDDDTPEIIKDATKAMSSSQFRILLEHRSSGEARSGGLATAVVLGMNKAQANYVAVIDADLQHPPAMLQVFYEQAVMQEADVVIASRYIQGGSFQGLDGAERRLISVGLKWVAKLLFPERLLRISDPLGGFFLLRRSLLQDVSLRPIGYKILLEILLRCPWQQVLEVPYHFQARAHGESKANMQQGLQALQHMQRLWLEVPAAGRIWKIGIVLLFNILIALLLFGITRSFTQTSTTLMLVAFALLGCLNFILFNRFILPSPTVDKHESFAHTQIRLEDSETVKLPASRSTVTPFYGIEDIQSMPAQRERNASPRFLSTAMVLTVLATIGWISFALPGAMLVLATVFIATAIVFTKNIHRDQATTMILAIAVGVSTIDYLSWRFAVTNWHGWWISIPLLFAETLGAIHALGFQFTVWPWPARKVEYGDDPTQYPIFVFIPTVNEGAAILRPTLEGIITARDKYLEKYPHGQVTIVLCNDGWVAKAANWEETELLAQELGVCCITRDKAGGAKAGNIENARQELKATGNALLVIFDADQIAKPDFLLKTVPPFSDPKMGWVQTGQYYANLNNPVSRWADDQQSMFYNVLCPGKASLNSAFICGTNVVIRAATLDQIGGFPQDSVTEDFAASIALHPSWRSIYLKDVLAIGLGPLDVPSYLKQQRRWAIGTLSVFRTHWREILLPEKDGLRIEQRIQYFLACTHYLCGLRDLIYLLSPILFILTGVPAVRSATLSDFLWHFVPYGLLSVIALWYSSRNITGLRGIIIGFGCFPVLIESLLSVILQRKVGFSVTSKQRGAKRSLSYLWVYVFSFLLCVTSLIFATRIKGHEQTSLFISILWVIYSMLLLGGFFLLNWKDLRFQAAVQKAGTPEESIAKLTYPSKLLNRKRGLNPLWNIALAALVALPILLSNSLDSLTIFASSKSTPFVISHDKTPTAYFGVSLPIQLLTKRIPVLRQDLSANFSIIGRTQDIHDNFDTTWANQLAAQHERPWITLQFGTFIAPQKPPLDANLPAIINGLHDQEIRHWAEDIRTYGKPVYLTFFLHADKNWSLSSGVAHGGIPQDVPLAWEHVRSIFSEVGTDNVAWVWAPADPVHDQPYAPPASSIDAVLQSFIDYPGTKWGDPETVLHQIEHRYPTKPIFVEASVNGPAVQKAAWLTKLGQAVYDNPQVYVLLYHEGGPDFNPTNQQIENWSLASDPQSLKVMQGIVAHLQQRASTYSS